MLIAEICINIQVKSINQTYTYVIPEKLNFLTAGWRVVVPFGNRKKVDGFILNVREIPDNNIFHFELKEIADVIDEEAWFTPAMFNAAKWLADFYLCPLAQSMALFMPMKRSFNIKSKYEKIFKLVGTFDEKIFKRTPAQLQALKIFKEKLQITASELRELKISADVLNKLIKKGLIEVELQRVFRDSYANINSVPKNFNLTAAQSAAVDSIKKSLDAKTFKGFLLHGVTGSGKTQVYIETAKISRQLGRRVLILVPEIALTGQIVTLFKAYFSDVLVIHSGLSVGERNDSFYKIRNGDAGIVIGARSALFTPIDNVGLIVVDEEQDNSYKQNHAPFYHARIVAEEFAKFHGATIIFGSATPSLETFYRAKTGELNYLELPQRIFNNPLPEVECVDMRKELKDGNRNVLSRALQNLLTQTFSKGQQSIILLNRRGWSTFVMCRSCGHVMTCPECGLPMAYHRDEKLRCHRCLIEKYSPKVCPVCSSKDIRFFGSGTEKLEEELKNFLPNAKVLRMDRDTTTQKLAHQKILEDFKSGKYDILCGTQMVSKGHDIPNVTAVGILSADATLFFPDFRAGELCFMLITQAAGRAGRADISGKVIVQAYNVDAPIVKFGCQQNYIAFYDYELSKRKRFFFPPYCRLVKILFMDEVKEIALTTAKNFVEDFQRELPLIKIEGPIPAMISNLRGVYRFSVLIKTLDLDAVRNFLRKKNLHEFDNVQIDFDPITTN